MHRLTYCLSLLSLCALFEAVPVTSDDLVKLPYGSFQGKVDRDLIQYLGIPFALPPYANHFVDFCVSVDIVAIWSIELVNIALGFRNPLCRSMEPVKQECSGMRALSKRLVFRKKFLCHFLLLQ